MKKILFLLLIITTVNVYGSGWRKAAEGSYAQLNDVFFLNENIGWAAGSSGTILLTHDGGHSWNAPADTLPVSESMYSIFFLDENIGYTGGNNDLILKTINGGNTWTQVPSDSNDGSIYSMYFVSENTGWVLSGTSKGGKVFYTTDGGNSWVEQLSESSTNLKKMSFSSPNHGICAGGKSGSFALYYTQDGINWTKSPNPTGIPGVYSRTDIYGLDMASDNVACVTGWGSSAAGLQPTFTIRSSDGGANWEYQTQAEDDRLYVNMYDITFKDELVGISVGGSTYKGGVFYKTTDGGITWKENYLPTGFQGKSSSIIGNKICIVGSNGGIVLSEDDGLTWELITKIPTSTLYSIKEIKQNTIVASGFYGVFLKSEDNGASWKASYVADNNTCPTVEDLCFLNDKLGFAAHRNRAVSKTTDGGETWTQIMKDTMATAVNNYGVQFINEDIGFVVGKAGSDVSAFYKTLDGGKNWLTTIANPELSNELNTLYFFDENNGVVAGDESAFAYTTDGGESWHKSVLNNMPAGNHDFNEVEFLNSTFGLAGGEVLTKSNDGGKTWTYVDVPDLPKKIYSLEIVDEQTWYVTGSKYLLKTTDGGATWSDIINLDVVTASTNYSLLIDSYNHPWVSCGLSEVYTTSSPHVDVKSIGANIPNEFTLGQNYPNPFNPTTKIKYSIPSASSDDVVLKVFDLLGQEVITLVNEVQKSGTYEVEFDANKLTSGIYIYTLQNAGLLKSRKMLLIK